MLRLNDAACHWLVCAGLCCLALLGGCTTHTTPAGCGMPRPAGVGWIGKVDSLDAEGVQFSLRASCIVVNERDVLITTHQLAKGELNNPSLVINGNVVSNFSVVSIGEHSANRDAVVHLRAASDLGVDALTFPVRLDAELPRGTKIYIFGYPFPTTRSLNSLERQSACIETVVGDQDVAEEAARKARGRYRFAEKSRFWIGEERPREFESNGMSGGPAFIEDEHGKLICVGVYSGEIWYRAPFRADTCRPVVYRLRRTNLPGLVDVRENAEPQDDHDAR